MKKSLLAAALIVLLCAFAGASAAKLDRETIRGEYTEDNFYISEWLDFAFDGGDAYVFATDEEMNDILAPAQDMMDSEESPFETKIDVSQNDTYFMDMMAVSPVNGSNLIIAVETPMFSANLTEEQYLDAVLSQYKDLSNADTGNLTFAGYEYLYFSNITEYSGVPTGQLQLIRKIDKSFVIFTFTYYADEQLEELLDRCYQLEPAE